MVNILKLQFSSKPSSRHFFTLYFYCIKSTFFDIITYYFKSYDSRKTNNTLIECPSRWVQNTRRIDLQLFQGLSRNLSFKNCVLLERLRDNP